MMQDTVSSNKIKENKYKILRMSLLLGNGDDKEETINNFEDAAKEIDSMNDDIYLKDLEDKFYDTLTLEEEEKKLTVLVDYIGGRIEQRMSLLSDFSNVTGFELEGLTPIKYCDKLDDYKKRLYYIREYLDNTTNINSLNKEVDEFEIKLNEAYRSKGEAEERNVKNEQEILNKFKNIIKDNSNFKDITVDNANEKLTEVMTLVEDSKKSLDIFDKSYDTLSHAGIDQEEAAEYMSYVNGAKDAYYHNKELEYLLRLYIILNLINKEYENILTKRDSVNEIMYDRINLRRQLEVEGEDCLAELYEILQRQYEGIANQKSNIDNIDVYSKEIEIRKDKISELEKDNQKVEILSLLREFCIIDTYEGLDSTFDTNGLLENSEVVPVEESMNIENMEVSNAEERQEVPAVDFGNEIEARDLFSSNKMDAVEDGEIPIDTMVSKTDDIHFESNHANVLDEKKEDNDLKEETKEEIKIENPKENQVVSVEDCEGINIEEAVAKSNSVMKRVGEMLGVKTSNTKVVSVENEENVSDSNHMKNKEVSSNQIVDSVHTENSENNVFEASQYDADPESGNIDDFKIENPLFNNELGNKTLDDVMAVNTELGDSNNFWETNEDSTLDLNSLPDIDVNHNNSFFGTDNGNNSLPNLDFPDFHANFSNDAKEENL